MNRLDEIKARLRQLTSMEQQRLLNHEEGVDIEVDDIPFILSRLETAIEALMMLKNRYPVGDWANFVSAEALKKIRGEE